MEITKITINTGNKEIDFTLDELREMRRCINELMPEPTYAPYYPSYPVYYPRPAPYYYEQPWITTTGDSGPIEDVYLQDAAFTMDLTTGKKVGCMGTTWGLT